MLHLVFTVLSFVTLVQGLQDDMLMDFNATLSTGASIILSPYEDEPYPTTGPYYEGSLVYNSAYLSRPYAIIKVATVEDVQKTVRFLNQHSLPFRIHSSGHNLAGYSGGSCAQYLVDVSNLRQITRTNGLTTFGPGLMAWELFEFLEPYREVVVSCEPSLHALGMILVGGISELSPVQGITADLVQELEVVVADGSLVTASTKKNSDLFYALRGAGSNSLGIVTSATIRAIPVPVNMGKGQYFLAGTEGAIQKFLRAYRDEVVLSKRSGVPEEMGTYLTLLATAEGRAFMLDWTYFGNDMTEAAKSLDTWVRNKAGSFQLTVEFTPGVATYEEFVANYKGQVTRTAQPEQWLSSFASSVSDTLFENLATLSTQAIREGADVSATLILPMHLNGNTENVFTKQASAFPFRGAKFWFLSFASCPFSYLGETSACQKFASNLLSAAKKDRGYLGLYHGIQNRIVETQSDFLNDYFTKKSNPSSWAKLMAAKQKYDPNNRFCAPQSIVPCAAPSADTCISRGLKPTP